MAVIDSFFIPRRVFTVLAGVLFISMSLTSCAELDKTLGTHTADSAPATFDKHGCLVQNGQYVGTYCYPKRFSGKQWYGYERSLLEAANWNPNQTMPDIVRDFSQGLTVLKWRDVSGDGTWFLKDASTGNVNAYYKGKWIPLQTYKNTIEADLEIQKIIQQSHQKTLDIILAPECTYSYNGC